MAASQPCPCQLGGWWEGSAAALVQLKQTGVQCFVMAFSNPDILPKELPVYSGTRGWDKRESSFHGFKDIFSYAAHEARRELFIHLLLPFLAPSLGGCGCYPCSVCLTAQSSQQHCC